MVAQASRANISQKDKGDPEVPHLRELDQKSRAKALSSSRKAVHFSVTLAVL